MASALRDGIKQNIANAKTMVFYVAVFAGAVPAGVTAATMCALVARVNLVALAW